MRLTSLCCCIEAIASLVGSEAKELELEPSAPSKKKAKSTYQKVAAAVLTVTGTTGLVLLSPKLVCSENHKDVAAAWSSVVKDRRQYLGSNACPVATGCDNMMRDKLLVDRLVQEHFPELVVLADGNIDAVHLKGEDLTHVFHRVTRSLPKKLTTDHGVFTRSLKNVLFRAKLSTLPPLPAYATEYPAASSDQGAADFYEEFINDASTPSPFVRMQRVLQALAVNLQVPRDF